MSELHVYVPLDSVAVSLGSDELVSALREQASKSNIDLRVTRTGSRGMHWLEPLLEVDGPNGRIGFGPVSSTDAASLFNAIVENDHETHPQHIGYVEALPFLKDQERLIFRKCGVIDPTSIDDFVFHGGFSGLDKALSLDPSDINEMILKSGLRGRGGAGFPAGIKWKTVQTANSDQKYVVVNADEGDSGTFADRMIMEGDPYLLLEGMIIAAIAVGATHGYIYLRSEYPIAATILNKAISAARENGFLGENIKGTGHTFDVSVFVGAGAYICGEETSLLNSLEGKRGEVRAKPPLPALEGLDGKPTLVHNVISLCSVPAILSEGAEFYQNIGAGRSTGTMPFQLAGNVKHGGIFEAGFGLSLHDLIHKYGGGTRSGKDIRAVQIGGPLGAYLPASMFDLSMDYETMAENGAGIGHGGVVLFDTDVDMWQQARYAFEFCAEESCGKCTPCRIGSVRGVEVLDKLRAAENAEAQQSILNDLCEVMEEGSLCAMGSMTPIPVRSAVEFFPEDFEANARYGGRK